VSRRGLLEVSEVTVDGFSSDSTFFESCSKPFPIEIICSFSDGNLVDHAVGRAVGKMEGPSVGPTVGRLVSK
jgi:hypothetical protein